MDPSGTNRAPRGVTDLADHRDLLGPQYRAEHDQSEGLDRADPEQKAAYSLLWAEIPDEADYLPNGTRRCTATAKNADATMDWPADRRRCRRTATPGSPVCTTHGSRTPQAARKARLRLIELVDPAIATVARLMANADSEAVRLRAAENVLDRAGYPRRSEVDIEAGREVLHERILILRNMQASAPADAAEQPMLDGQPRQDPSP